jgi:hypothetical protein
MSDQASIDKTKAAMRQVGTTLTSPAVKVCSPNQSSVSAATKAMYAKTHRERK